MKLIWITDPHLDHLGPGGGALDFGRLVKESYEGDTVVVTGDIGECPTFSQLIEDFARGIDKPVWFILGNHDCYLGSISEARVTASKLKGQAKWLPSNGIVPLTPETALCGVDGWYDARNGDWKRTPIFLNDFLRIRELAPFRGQKLIDKIRGIADQAAENGRAILETVIDAGYKRIVFATHVPPFGLAAWHEGATSDKNWQPWMSSRVMGEMLVEVADAHSTIEFIVLCGHTHGKGVYNARPNLEVRTGHSEYRYPRVCGQFEF